MINTNAIELKFLASIEQAVAQVKKLQGFVGDSMDGINKAVGFAAGALAALGVGLSVASFAGFIRNAINAADAAGDMAARMGVAVEEVAGLQLAFKFSDVEGDAMVGTMGKLSQAVDGGSKALDAMGIKTTDANGKLRSTKDVLYESADAIAAMEDGAAKNVLVLDLFGKQGLALIPMLNDGSQGMKDMADMAERLGLVVSKDTQTAAAAFNDTLDLISLSAQGVGMRLAQQLLPTLQSLTGHFFEALTEGDNLTKVSDFLATSLKILYSVALGVSKAFQIVGQYWGGLFAMIGAAMRGDFSAAKDIAVSMTVDLVSSVKSAVSSIGDVWGSAGDKSVAQAAAAARAGKEIRMKSDADKAAADKAAADALAAQIEKLKALDKVAVESKKDALEDIALAVKLGKKTEDDAIAESLAREQKTVAERIALVERERAARKAAGLLTLKDAEQLNGRVQELNRAAMDAERKAAADLALLEKARQDAAAKALADLYDKRARETEAAEAAVLAQRQENEAIGLTGVALAQLQQTRSNEAAMVLEAQAATLLSKSGREAEAMAILGQAAALRELASLKVEGAGLQSAQEAAKALEASLDPAKPKDFGTALKDAFGEAGNALAQMANALQDYGQAMAEVQKDRENLDKVTDPQKRAKFEIDLANKSAKAQIGAFAGMAGAAKSFFKEHSTGYRAMQAAEQTFRAFEMAMALESMARQIFGYEMSTAAKLAGDAAKNTSEVATVGTTVTSEAAKQSAFGLTALVASLAGPFPANLVAFGVIAAMVAALGVAVSGGGGGGASQGYQGIAAGGSGTVLGAEGEGSKSITNAIELLAENSRIELVIGQRMLSELTKVVEGIAALGADLSSDFFIRGMAGGSFGDSFLDSGVGFLPGQSVGDIIREGVQGFGFNLLFQNGAMAMWKELDPAFKRSVGDVLGNIADTIVSAADLLGLNDGSLVDRMLSIIPTLGDTSTYLMNGIMQAGGGLLSFKDKSGSEIREELQAVFSSVGDDMVGKALPALKRFQLVGEGLFETMVRVTSGIERAEYALERYGIAAINYADIVRDNGDVATEIVRQSVMALEPLGSGVSKIIDAFTGEFEDLLDLYGQLMTVRGLLRDIGADDMLLGTAQVRGAGGIDNLMSGIEAFRDSFYSEQEQVAAAWARMSEQFDILGVSMPRTTEEFRVLALAQDQSTQEGAHLFGGLMALAAAFADVTDRTADLEAAAVQAAQEAAQAQAQAAQAQAEAAEEAARRIADSWANLWKAVDGVAADFLSGDALRQYRAESLAEQFAGIGIGVDASVLLKAGKQDFLNLYHSIDKTTTAGREQSAALLGLWSAFKQILPATEEAANAVQAAADAMEALRRAAQQQTDVAFAALQKSITAQKAALQSAYDAQVKIVQDRTQAAVAAQQDRLSAITSIFNALDAAIGSTRVETLELTRARRQASQAYLAQALAAGQAGQSLSGFSGLEVALQTVAEPSQDLYSTFDQYAIDQAKTAADIFNLREISRGQMTTAELTLKAIEDAGDAQLQALKAKYDADTAALDETLEYWRTQIEIARGTYVATVSVEAAIRALDAALRSEAVLGGAGAGSVGVGAGSSIWRALDGSHATGLANVPFDGYLAELHRGERVLTAQDNAIFSSGAWARGSNDGAVVAELREVRAELSRLRAQQADESSAADEKLSTMADALDDAVTGRRPLQTEAA